MKGVKAYSLRTAQAVARFGKAARHPVCQAGLRLWQLETEISKLADDAALFEVEVLNSAEQQKKEVIKLYRETRNTNVAADASLLLGKIKALLSKGRACYDAMVKYAAFLLHLERYANVRFKREYKAADAPARKALREVKKRWKENPDGLSSLEHKILKILQHKVVSGAGVKGGTLAAYWEVGSSGKRALTDESFRGRLTAREIHSRLVVAGVLDGTETKRLAELHEIRRVADRLGIRLAADQRGRKWKAPVPVKQKPKKQRGRPPKVKPVFYGDTDIPQGAMIRKERGIVDRDAEYDIDQRPGAEDDEATISREIADFNREQQDYVVQAQPELEAIEREIRRLKRRQRKLGTAPAYGKGIYVYE